MTLPPDSPSPSPPARGRASWRIAGVGAAVAVLALAALDQAARPVGGRRPGGSRQAAWIWSADSPRETSPRAFYLVQDFEVDEPPAEAPLLVLGDEEYVLHLNGQRVGSNRYAEGASLDRYEVAPLLTRGANRLVAEVRSGRGVGGFLLRLDGGADGPPLTASDGSWRVFRRHHRGLLGGWLPLAAGEPPRVWGGPPVGHWGRPRPGPSRPLFPPLDAGAPREAIAPAGPAVALASHASPPEAGGGRGAWRLDFGRPVAGYLRLRFASGDGSPALLCVGASPPTACGQDADGYVLAPPGAPEWEDSVMRRFRYAAVVGLRPETAAEVIPVGAETAPALASPSAQRPGLLGIEPPPRLTPVEREVVRRLRAEAAAKP